jgi:stage II sporulation protein GA (sporulation sigma-E factor processing peptidase)
VYVDVLLIINFIMNLVLIRLAALFSGRDFIAKRVILAAALGACGALIIFAPYGGFWVSGLYKLSLSACMALAAFPFRGLPAFLRDIFCLFSVSFLFSGIMLAIWLGLEPDRMAVYNGVVYFDISAAALLGVTVICYPLVTLLSRILHRRAADGQICEVTLCGEGKSKTLKALIDTGNSLTEPFSQRPVDCVRHGRYPRNPARGLMGAYPDPQQARRMGFRIIPYHAVGASGLLPAFSPREIRIRTDTGTVMAQGGCFVAVSREKIGGMQYQAVLNPEILNMHESKVGGAQ